ncbi:MAG TPA: ankyrin repeat domain-containing protein [Candidatus Acidoferrum sp.]|nr:ankyrin repeat domain-containing protein [Candidatus Acidoferrum sp.]
MNNRFVTRTLAGAVLTALLANAALAVEGNEQQLLALASSGNTKGALSLLKNNTDVNQSQADGTTALHWAIYYNDADLVKKLIAQKADVHAKNEFGATPMSQAAIAGNVEILKALLDAGVKADEAGADGQTPLMVIARTPNVKAAELLIKAGANVNAAEQWRGQTALMWAAAEKQPAMLQLLIDKGAKVDIKSAPNNWERQVTAEPRMKILPPGSLSALHYAAREGCTECVAKLIKAGADLNIVDGDGVTPLVMAGLNARWDSMKLLLEAGANPDKWDVYGRNPLYMVADYNTLPHGGRSDKLSDDLAKPLEIADLILAKGGNVNLQLKLFPPYRALGPDRGADGLLKTGTTSLFRAARGGDLAMTDLLLKHGALVDLPNEDGLTPLIVAAGIRAAAIDTRGKYRTEKEGYAVTKRLLEAGANVNAADNFGQTALFGAATSAWNSVVQLLVDNGADLNHKDSAGKTALDAALGKAGQFGRGSGGDPHPETAALIEKLAAAKK